MRKAMVVLILSLLALPIAYNACAPAFEVANSNKSVQSSLCTTAKVADPNLNVFSGKKTHLIPDDTSVQGFSKAQNPTLPAGLEITALIDLKCQAAQDSLSTRIRQASAQSSYDETYLSRKAYTWKLPEATDAHQFEEWTQQDSCILSVSKEIQEHYHIDAQLGHEELIPADDMRLQAASNDPLVSSQPYLSDMEANAAYDYFFNTQTGINKTVVVGVVDTGTYSGHEDLTSGLWRTPQGVLGYNALSPGSNAEGSGHYHGTFVAGIIAATANNGKGIRGVMGQYVKVMPLKFTDTDSGSTAAAMNALQFGIDNGADVINMSLGSDADSTTRQQMIQDATNKGIVVVVAAGNDNVDIGVEKQYPAYYGVTLNGLITVGATIAGTKAKSDFSNYSNQLVEISAQGTKVASTDCRTADVFKTTKSCNGNPSSYIFSNGTSFSTPIVSAVAGLIIGMFKTHNIPYTAALVEEIIKDGSITVSSLSPYVQNGRWLSLKQVANVMKQRFPQTVSSSAGNPNSGGNPTPTPTPTPQQPNGC